MCKGIVSSELQRGVCVCVRAHGTEEGKGVREGGEPTRTNRVASSNRLSKWRDLIS